MSTPTDADLLASLAPPRPGEEVCSNCGHGRRVHEQFDFARCAWPRVPPPRDPPGTFTLDDDFGPPPPPMPTGETACKHGSDECEECGTTKRRDATHSTRGGVGKVGALRRGR